MSSWFERQINSHNVQLAGVALISGATVAGLIYGTQAMQRKTAVEELKASIPEFDEGKTQNVSYVVPTKTSCLVSWGLVRRELS